MSYRKYELGSYEEMCAAHRWEVPERYNIARDVCDKHEPDRLAMVWEDWQGNERRVTFGEIQELSNRFANVLGRVGVERGDRVATLLPSLPRPPRSSSAPTSAARSCCRCRCSTATRGSSTACATRAPRLVVTDAANRHRIPDGARGDGARAGRRTSRPRWTTASPRYETVDTRADDPAQLYYSSGTTGLAKGILHAHRYLLAHEEFEFCHDVRDGELFHGSGEWAWAAGICPLLGPWRYGAVALVQARKGGYDPEEHLRFLSKHGVENMFTTPTALRAMTGVADAGKRYPLESCASPARPASRSTPR